MKNKIPLPRCCERHITQCWVVSPTACDWCSNYLVVSDGMWIIKNPPAGNIIEPQEYLSPDDLRAMADPWW